MPAAHPESIVKIKDNYRVIIYYRNVPYSTGYTLDSGKDLKGQFKKGRLTKSWGDNHEEANTKIYEKKNLIDSLIKDANSQGVKANPYIKAYLDKKTNQVKQHFDLSNLSISELFQKFVDFKNEKNKHKKKKTGINKYIDVQKRLLEFEIKGGKEGKRRNINQIDLKWRNNLSEFLVTKREEKIGVTDGSRTFKQIKKRGISNSTLNGYMWVLMNYFEWVEYNFKIELDRDLKEFTPYPCPTPEENIITPTLKQWNDYKDCKPPSKSLQKTFDLSILSAYSGMRYSDCVTLFYDHVQGESKNPFEIQEPIKIRKNEDNPEGKEISIKKKAIKTDGYFEVTLNPVALALFEKYNRDMRQKFPKDQQINKNLRRIWKTLPSWRTKVKYKVYILDKEIEIEDYFYNVASFHIFRKIFTTFLVAQNNFSTDEIMRMTGWKDERMLRHYRNVFNDYNRREKQIMF
jgi:integrase